MVPERLWIAGLTAASTWLLGFPARWLGRRLHILDVPSARSSHASPIPRTGGLAIVFGMSVAVFVLHPPLLPTLALVAMVLTLAALGLLDDIYSLPATLRLAIQIVVGAAATLLCHAYFFDTHDPTQVMFWVSVVFVALFTVAFINFFNFMDGINGLACSQGIL